MPCRSERKAQEGPSQAVNDSGQEGRHFTFIHRLLARTPHVVSTKQEGQWESTILSIVLQWGEQELSGRPHSKDIGFRSSAIINCGDLEKVGLIGMVRVEQHILKAIMNLAMQIFGRRVVKAEWIDSTNNLRPGCAVLFEERSRSVTRVDWVRQEFCRDEQSDVMGSERVRRCRPLWWTCRCPK